MDVNESIDLLSFKDTYVCLRFFVYTIKKKNAINRNAFCSSMVSENVHKKSSILSVPTSRK